MSTGKVAPARPVLKDAVAVSAGKFYCLALKSDGSVVRWMGNDRSQASFENVTMTADDGTGSGDPILMQKTKTITNGLVKINGQAMHDVISVAAGGGAGEGFSLALKSDGTVVNWGENSMPTWLSNVVAIAAAGFEGFVVKSDGTVVQWTGEKLMPESRVLHWVPELSNVVAVAVAENDQGTRKVALLRDGTVVNWRRGIYYAHETPPFGLSNVVSIAAGSYHTLAVKQDGTVVGWGFNDVGQATGVATTNSPYTSSGVVRIGGEILSNVVSVAANHNYSMALKRDGTIVAWGRMEYRLHPTIVPAGLSNVVAIAAGDNFCLAITTNDVVAEKFRQ